MGIDTQKIQACTWRIFTVLINICLRFVNSHPYVSSTLSFLFFLYVHYPLVLKILIYSSPVLLGSVVYLWYHLNRDKLKNLSQDDKEKKDHHGLLFGNYGSAGDNFSVEAMGVRRNVIETSTKEIDDLISKNLSKNENLKDTRNKKGSAASLDCMESSSRVSRNCSDDWSMKNCGSTDNIDGLNMEDDDDEEEETQEDRNKVVEWNEDDEKNLTELGTSEIERNKRLESLIEKRRARKVLSMQVQRNLIDLVSQAVAPILISRNNPFDIPVNGTEADGLQIPGSAPSVLQMKNPFDLPYDPNEEKPILTGDSFEKDFMIAPKDLCFCRHESFGLGMSPWEVKPDLHDPNSNPFFVSEKRASRGPIMSRFRRQSEENLAEEVLSLNTENLPQSETARDHVKNQQGDSIEKVGGSLDYNHDTDKEDDHNNAEVNGERKESEHKDDHETTLNDFPSALKNSLQNSFTCANPEKIPIEVENINQASHEPYYDSSPSARGKPRMDEEMFYEERIPGHTPSFSIASDMQVEVSEIGSPPLTIGTVSPPDVESVSYEGDVEKEIIPGSEELWGAASSHLSGIDQNESCFRAVHMISEDDIIGVGFSGIKESSKDSTESMMLQEEGQTQEAIKTLTDKLLIDPSGGDGSSISSKEAQSLTGKPLVSSSREDGSNYSGEHYNPPQESLDNVNFIQNGSGFTEYLPILDDNTGEPQLPAMHNTISESNLTDQEGTQTTAQLSSDNSSITSIQSEFTAEHAAFDSSLPSSPKSVLPETVFYDEYPSSRLDPISQVDVVQSTAEDSLLPETNPLIEEQLVDNSTDSSANLDRSVEGTQEPSSLQEESSKEADIMMRYMSHIGNVETLQTINIDHVPNTLTTYEAPIRVRGFGCGDTGAEDSAFLKKTRIRVRQGYVYIIVLHEDTTIKMADECTDNERGESQNLVREEANPGHPEEVTVTEGDETILTQSSPSGEIHHQNPIDGD